MTINWQDIFYFTASLAMIMVFISCIWLMQLFYITSKVINNFIASFQRWNGVVDDIKYFRKNVQLKILSFILQILNKGAKNE